MSLLGTPSPISPGGSASVLTIPMPAGAQEGEEILILVGFASVNPGATTINVGTLIDEQSDSFLLHSKQYSYTYPASGAPANIIVTFSASNRCGAIALRSSPLLSIGAFSSTIPGVRDTNHTAPTLTTASDNATVLRVYVIIDEFDAGDVSAFTLPATQFGETVNSVANACYIGVSEESFPTSGTATGTAVATSTNTERSISTTLILYDAPVIGITDVDSDSELQDGQVDATLTVSNFGADINSVTISDGTYITENLLSGGTGDNYTFTLPNVSGQNGSSIAGQVNWFGGSLTLSATDGTDTSQVAITWNPSAGWAFQSVTGDVQEVGSISENRPSGGAYANNSIAYYPTASSTVIDSGGKIITGAQTQFKIKVWDSVDGQIEDVTVLSAAPGVTLPPENTVVFNGGSAIVAPSLGNITAAKIQVTFERLSWSQQTGYLVGQIGQSVASREFGLYRVNDELLMWAGGVGKTIGSFTEIFGTNTPAGVKFDFVLNVDGSYAIEVNDTPVTLTSPTIARGTDRINGVLLRIGARALANNAAIDSAYFMGANDEVGNVTITLADVVQRFYRMPSSGTVVPDIENGEDAALINATGDGSDWRVITPGDITPFPFTFVDLTDQARGATLTSNAITVAGVSDGAIIPVSIAFGTYQVSNDSGETWGAATAAPTTVVLNAQVRVIVTSSASEADTVSATLTIGGVSDTFSVTTLETITDTTPDQFTLIPDANGVALNAVVSGSFTVAGINAASPISVVNCEYSINDELGYTSIAGSVNNGDVIYYRVTASATNSVAVTATVDIGGVSDQVVVTTAEAAGVGPVVTQPIDAEFQLTVGQPFSLLLSDYFEDPDSVLSYSVASGTLPDGLYLDPVSSLISGTPTRVDSFENIIFRATEV